MTDDNALFCIPAVYLAVRNEREGLWFLFGHILDAESKAGQL